MLNSLLIAKSADKECVLLPSLANRHGCITGATGTGKTVTLQVIAQALSDIGVPVFMADVKGDLSGLAKAGALTPKMKQRLELLGASEPAWSASPVTFWDVYGEQGHPVRATLSDLGPLMLARMLNLNDTQEGVLQLVFKIADEMGCFCSTPRICGQCCSMSATMLPAFGPSTATFRRPASGRSSAD